MFSSLSWSYLGNKLLRASIILFVQSLLKWMNDSSPKSRIDNLKAHSHYCVFRVRLRQTVALLRRDRKFLSLRWRSPLRNPQTAAASVNEPYKNIFSIKFLFVGFECSDCWKFWLKIKKSQSENWKVLHRIVSWVPVERGQSLMQNFAARESVRPNSVQNCFRSKLNNFPCYKNIGTIIFYILSIISMSY